MMVPADAAGGLSDDFREQLRRQYGLDQPILVQYRDYLLGLVRFDLGRSLRTDRPIAQDLLERYPATIILAAAGLVVALVLAIPLGVNAALNRGTVRDKTWMGVLLVLGSIPEFVLGLALMNWLSLRFGWLPASGTGDWRYLVLPALSLGLGSAALFARLIRSSLLEVLQSDFVRTARAKGLTRRRVIYGHAFRNALIPFVTAFGIRLGYLLGGAIVVETIFAWPGIGRYLVDAILKRDLFVVRSTALAIAVGFVAINIAVDVLYVVLNPRIRYR
jgi:ABC-type dipeptide/oligopeptide/nickel transport system permease component